MLRDAAGWLMLVWCLAACSAKTAYPEDWSATDTSHEWCQLPHGAFSDAPLKATDAEDTLALKQVFFADLLNGFDVTHLTLESLADGTVSVRPWVGDTMLKQELVLKPVADSCDRLRWVIDSGWDFDGYMMASGLIWTGGLLIPAAAKVYFALDFNLEQQLIVHATVKVAGAFAFVFPFRGRIDDEWFVYPAYVVQPAAADEALE